MLKITNRGRAALVAAGVVAGVATANLGWGADANASRSARPNVVGAYHRVVETPAHPQEDQVGWNCFTDGNGACGDDAAMIKATGFSRPGWRVTCLYYDDVKINNGRYVMCSDGSVFVKLPRR